MRLKVHLVPLLSSSSTLNHLRLTGWNTIKNRVQQLRLKMTDDQVKVLTSKIKALADVRPVAIDDMDSIIRTFHLELQQENGPTNGHEMPETNGVAKAIAV